MGNTIPNLMLWSTVPQQNSMENIEPHGTAAANGEHHNTDDIYGFVTDPSSPYFGPHFVIAPAPLLQADKHNSTTSTASPSSTTTDNFNNSNNNRNNANRGDRRRSNDIRIEFDSDGNLIANPSSTSDDRVLPLLEATSPLWHEIWSTVASGRKMDKIGFQKYKIPLHPETPSPKTQHATTLQCRVNIKKDTIKLFPCLSPSNEDLAANIIPLSPVGTTMSAVETMVGSPILERTNSNNNSNNKKYRLEFKFDASVECMIRIYSIVKEVIVVDTRTGQSNGLQNIILRAKDNSKPHCISYGPFPPGLCQSFAMHVPSEYLDGSIIQKHYSTIETSSTQAVEPVVKVGREQSFGSSSVDNNDSSNNQKHASKIANNGEDNKDDSNKNSDKLDAATTSPDPSALIFSVVVSLEMVVPSLSESFEKAALEGMPNPVNSQQTYIMATSVIPSNIVDMKIVKQKINIDGTQYLLHDVFGFKETSNGGEKNSDLDASSRDCVICMCEPRDVIVLPCRHLCVCRDCADVLRNQGKQPQPLTLAEAAPAAESPSTATTANAAEGPDDAATPSTAVNPTSPPITLTTQPPRRTGFNRSLNQLIGSLAETIRQIGVDPILQIPSPTNASGHRPTGPPKCPLCREEFHSLLQIKLPPPPPSDLLRHVVDKADEF